MSRCDYCENRFTWDCEDFRLSNDVICKDFELDFSTLSKKQKKAVQKILMHQEETWD